LIVFLAFVAAMVAATGAHAMRRVEPGEPVVLRPDQGLVLVAVDTSHDLRAASLRRVGRNHNAGTMRQPGKGLNHDLYVAETGRYGWHNLRTIGVRWTFKEEADVEFDVKPGVINYPGDLVFRAEGDFMVQMFLANRSLAAIDWLRTTHPGLVEGFAVAYSGRYPDPFPAFLAKSPARTLEAKPDFGLRPPPPPRSEPRLSVDELWRDLAVTEASLSPDGGRVLLQEKRSDELWELSLVDLKAQSSSVVVRSPMPLVQVQWVGHSRFVAAVDNPNGRGRVHLFRVDAAPSGGWTISKTTIRRAADLVHAFARPEPTIIIATTNDDGAMLHRLSLEDIESLERVTPKPADRINGGFRNDMAWLFDAEGRPGVALVYEDERIKLVRPGEDGHVAIVDDEEGPGFEPVGLSHDGRLMYALAQEDRPQRELIALEVATGKVQPTVFSREGIDVSAPLFDADGRLVGVRYYRSGRLVSEYFDPAEAAVTRRIAAAFPGRTVSEADRSGDGRQRLLWVDGAELPPTLFHLDLSNGVAMQIASSMPWLDGKPLAPAKVIAFKGADGLPLEAFLTLPPGVANPPLVVHPHGGPIGIADTLHFDPAVQYMAGLGYAVLQVNFRGSDGYGGAFREAAHRNYGKAIEDDIDAAVNHVIANEAIDEQRMCMVGSSYGGYSGLVAAVRWPTKYRCVVSLFGVSDRALFFTASDGARSEEGRATLEKIIGDPNADLDEMVAHSPLYHADRLVAPVMLVHGMEDQRVDPEHSRRMARMLESAGRPAVGYLFADEGHGIEDKDHRRTAWQGIAGFLQQHLGAAR
jgi:dipeptidyl aminopeptidase/acylaminoacyl peptidase